MPIRMPMAIIAALLLHASAATAQDFPTRQITLVMPFAAGGPGDAIARVFGQSMGTALGQQIIVENVGGAGGTIGVARAASAKPDGYTVLLHHIGMATNTAIVSAPSASPVL